MELTEATLLDKWRKFHAHHEWGPSGQYAPLTSCCVHRGSLVQPHRSRGFTVAQSLWYSPSEWLKETRLCCALGEQREASICCHSLLAIKIALGIDSASGKDGGTEGDHLESD